MLCHPTLLKHKKCVTCGYTCLIEDKPQEKLELRSDTQKEPSEAVKKALGIK